MGNTATITVVCTADRAQSYIAHARSSGRSSPSVLRIPPRAGRVESVIRISGWDVWTVDAGGGGGDTAGDVGGGVGGRKARRRRRLAGSGATASGGAGSGATTCGGAGSGAGLRPAGNSALRAGRSAADRRP